MNAWGTRTINAIFIAIFEVSLVKYFHFSFWAVVLFPLFLGLLIWFLEHKNFAWGLILGTVLFTVGMSVFGWTFMEGWVKPADFFKR